MNILEAYRKLWDAVGEFPLWDRAITVKDTRELGDLFSSLPTPGDVSDLSVHGLNEEAARVREVERARCAGIAREEASKLKRFSQGYCLGHYIADRIEEDA
jgi:hypothetical protein